MIITTISTLQFIYSGKVVNHLSRTEIYDCSYQELINVVEFSMKLHKSITKKKLAKIYGINYSINLSRAQLVKKFRQLTSIPLINHDGLYNINVVFCLDRSSSKSIIAVMFAFEFKTK